MYYSKLAIIELCGWIEISIDEIIQKRANFLLVNSSSHSKVTDRIGKTFGFHEKKHFKPLIELLIGLHGVEIIEKSCDSSKIGSLFRNLNELTQIRNTLAHTYITGFGLTIDSPQITLNRLDAVADGLEHVEDVFSKLDRKLAQIVIEV